MKKFRLLFLTSIAALPAAPAFAQSDADEIVVTAAGVAQRADEVGRSVTLIDRDEIEQRQTVAIADLLATTPGVGVTRNGGIGGFTGVRIRGAEGEQTLVLIDGVRVNDPSAPAGGYDFANLLAGAVERVEVLRGPNSVVWGSQAIGGVVNLVTAKVRTGFAGRGNIEYGAQNSVSANTALTGGNDSVSGALTAGYYDSDGISAAASGTEPDGFRQYGASGRVEVAFAPGFALDLRGYYAHSRAELDGYPAPAFLFADTDEYQVSQEAYGYAGLRAALGAVRNRLAFTIADVNRDNYDPATGAGPAFFSRGRSERYEYQGDVAVSRALRLVFGAEHEDSRFSDGNVARGQGVTGLYGEAIVTPFAPLTVTLGVRNDDHSGFGSHRSWGANAAFRAAPGTLIRASYGEGFKAPTLYQRFSAYGDPDLAPEVAKSYEIGAEQALLDGRVRIAATWFHRDTDQQIDFDLATFTYFNVARTRTEGVEFEALLRPAAGFTLRANYTHLDAENRSPGANLGNALARRPRDAASVSADYRLGSGLSFGGTLLIVGDSFDDAGNFVRLDGFAVAGVRAEMPLGRSLSLYGRVDNLFDARYQTVATYNTPGRAAYGGVRVRLD